VPDYYLRGLALWPRLEPPRPEYVRYDAKRTAARISRRTTLSTEAILALLGAGGNADHAPPEGR
jgi:hypothetical protein